jgi:hypothetical protein
MKYKMKAKNLIGSFLAILAVLFLATTVSASEIATIKSIEVDGMTVDSSNNLISVIVGKTIDVKIEFIALEDASDVRMKAELEGDKQDVSARTDFFDIETGKRYTQKVSIRVPYELEDEISDDLSLELKIWNSKHETEFSEIILRIQRPSYNLDFMSISTDQNIEVGETIPVDIVIKNIGYNKLDDLYVTARITALGVEKTAYFGDLVSIECCENDPDCCDSYEKDYSKGRLFLEIPYDAVEGTYTLEVVAENGDLIEKEIKRVEIQNDFSAGNVIVDSTSKSIAVGEKALFNLVLVNPTNKLKVYKIIPESFGALNSEASESVIAIPAGSSRTVKITAEVETKGNYGFDVHIFSGEELVNTVKLDVNASGSSVTSPVTILTIVLAIIFLVLLVILIALLGKKPEKTEEFGESYY